jgi:hypothetical protein
VHRFATRELTPHPSRLAFTAVSEKLTGGEREACRCGERLRIGLVQEQCLLDVVVQAANRGLHRPPHPGIGAGPAMFDEQNGQQRMGLDPRQPAVAVALLCDLAIWELGW